MNYVTVEITGATNLWKLADVHDLTTYKRIYRKGSAEGLYVDLSREEADLLVASLHASGISARILNG